MVDVRHADAAVDRRDCNIFLADRANVSRNSCDSLREKLPALRKNFRRVKEFGVLLIDTIGKFAVMSWHVSI